MRGAQSNRVPGRSEPLLRPVAAKPPCQRAFATAFTASTACGGSEMKPTVLELCSGAGGQALGFESAGFAHAALIDSDPHSCATIRINRPYWNVIEADIRKFVTCYWRGVDVVAAGLPCPPFSVAGQQLGGDDERNLFPAFMRILSETRPRVAVVENVRGLLGRRFAAYRDSLEEELGILGFKSAWCLLNALDQGVPQSRVRSFLVARRGDRDFAWPRPNRGGATVGQTLFELMASNGWKRAREWSEKANRPAPTLVGGSRKHGGPDLGPTRARNAWAELGVDGLGVADEAPSPDFEGHPKLTVSMASRLQSFPDDWSLAGSKTQRYRQVGNALPPNLARAVARSIARWLAA